MEAYIPLAKKLRSIGRFSNEELSLFARIQRQSITLKSGDQLVFSSARKERVLIIAEGWVARARAFPDGRRQIVSLALPGDCLGLHTLLGAKSVFEYEIISDGLAMSLDAEKLVRELPEAPQLFMRIMWFSAQDSFIAAEHIVDTGKRTAYERMLHFLLETWHRLRRIGLADSQGFIMQLNQRQLGDVLGLTSVHISRILRRMREQGLVQVDSHSPRAVRFLDADAAAKACDFSTEYLDLPPFS